MIGEGWLCVDVAQFGRIKDQITFKKMISTFLTLNNVKKQTSPSWVGCWRIRSFMKDLRVTITSISPDVTNGRRRPLDL